MKAYLQKKESHCHRKFILATGCTATAFLGPGIDTFMKWFAGWIAFDTDRYDNLADDE